MKNNLILIAIMALLVGGGAGFFVGMKYQSSRRSGLMGQFGNFAGGRMGGTNRNGFRPVNGEILSIDNNSITVKLQDNSSSIVLVSDKTTISKADPGTKSDLKVGEKVAVFGQPNADGSVTAQNIQLNPQERLNPTGSSATPSAK